MLDPRIMLHYKIVVIFLCIVLFFTFCETLFTPATQTTQFQFKNSGDRSKILKKRTSLQYCQTGNLYKKMKLIYIHTENIEKTLCDTKVVHTVDDEVVQYLYAHFTHYFQSIMVQTCSKLDSVMK